MSIQEQFEAAVKVIQNLPKNGELANFKSFQIEKKNIFYNKAYDTAQFVVCSSILNAVSEIRLSDQLQLLCNAKKEIKKERKKEEQKERKKEKKQVRKNERRIERKKVRNKQTTQPKMFFHHAPSRSIPTVQRNDVAVLLVLQAGHTGPMHHPQAGVLGHREQGQVECLVRCQFHQHFTRSFYARRSQKRKKDSQLKQLFVLAGSVGIKAVCKHVDEIDP